MNPKHLSVRMDRETGALWLTEEKYRKPPRRVVDLTAPIFLAMCADLVAEEGTKSVTRDMKFSDGFAARLTVEVIEDKEDQDEPEILNVGVDARLSGVASVAPIHPGLRSAIGKDTSCMGDGEVTSGTPAMDAIASYGLPDTP